VGDSNLIWGRYLDVAHWVGAVKRDAEGSYMQLPPQSRPAF